jgi:hypothetical protein
MPDASLEEDVIMTVDRGLRGIAGGFVLVSLGLGYWIHPAWFLFTAFVGANLFQSAFTNWCPAMVALRKLGVPDTAKADCCGERQASPVSKPGCCGGTMS